MALNISSVVVLTRQVRLLVAAGAAKPGPAIGQALGPLGLNMANFCKEFNDKTKHYEKDLILPVILSGKHCLFPYCSGGQSLSASFPTAYLAP